MTPAQLVTLKAAILAEVDPTFADYRDQGATGLMAEWFNAASTFVVWRNNTPTSDIANAVSWANFTPADTPDGTALWTNRALACQGKQFNLQNLFLAAQGSLSSGLTNIRQGIQDSLTNVPAGASGASVSAGWAAVRTAMQRFATRGEKVFATGTGTAATPGVLTFEGGVSDYDVVQALGS